MKFVYFDGNDIHSLPSYFDEVRLSDALVSIDDQYYYIDKDGFPYCLPWDLVENMAQSDDDVYGWVNQSKLDAQNFPLTFKDVAEMKAWHDKYYGPENVKVSILQEGGYSAMFECFTDGVLSAKGFTPRYESYV